MADSNSKRALVGGVLAATIGAMFVQIYRNRSKVWKGRNLKVKALWIHPIKSCAAQAVDVLSLDRLGVAGDRRFMIIDENNQMVTQRQHPKMALIKPVVRVEEVRGEPQRRLAHIELSIATGRSDDAVVEDFVVDENTIEKTAVQVWGDRVIVGMLPRDSAVNRFLSGYLGHPVFLTIILSNHSRPAHPAYDTPTEDGESHHSSFTDAFPILIANESSLTDLNHRLAYKGEDSVPMESFRPNIVVEGSELAPWAEDHWKRLRIGASHIRLNIVKPCDRCTVPTVNPSTGKRRANLQPIPTLREFREAESGVYFAQNAINVDPEGLIRVGDAVVVTETQPLPLQQLVQFLKLKKQAYQ